MSGNPYEAPGTISSPSLAEESALSIRQAHINHEASVRSISLLYGLCAIILSLVTATAILDVVKNLGQIHADVAAMAGVVGKAAVRLVLVGGMAAALWTAAYGIKRLKPWARMMGIVLSGIGLIGIPIGTILGAYILYLLLSRKGRMVFSPEYRDIISATPGVAYKGSATIWMIFGVALLLVIVGLFAGIMGFH